ncbi:MAG: class I SAM-dependent methyltransferase [Planctomycetales bacterium]|nr:class I SAM-dependent methyltransferase [Planctomycetales bacterium]
MTAENDDPLPADSVVLHHNQRAWDALARQQVPLAQPATDDELRQPLQTVDPLGWLGPDIANWSVLCLAAGGGRHSALYAAAGAKVTVVDLSSEMLALDRQVAAERDLQITPIQTSMDALPMLADSQFDLVIHPVSTCYVPDVRLVFREIARVTRPGGLYVSQHKSPISLQTEVRPEGNLYRLREPYYRTGPLPSAEPCRTREPGTQEFLHRWEELLGGICRAGFVIEDLVEPMHAKPQAEVGTFAHRSQYVAPYVRIKSRRTETDKPRSILRIE